MGKTSAKPDAADYFLTPHCNTWWITLPRRSRLIFQVDLFPAHGRLLDNLDEVNEREKDARYSSQTRLTTDILREKHDVRHAINELHKLLPPDIANTEQAKRLYEYGCVTEMDIVQLIYRTNEPQGALKDFQFGRSTMEERWQQGLRPEQGQYSDVFFWCARTLKYRDAISENVDAECLGGLGIDDKLSVSRGAAKPELPISPPNVNFVCRRCQEGLRRADHTNRSARFCRWPPNIFRRHWFGLNISGTRKATVEV